MLEEANLLDEDYDRTTVRTSGTSLTSGNEAYATSLFWQPLQNKEDPYAEVGEAAEGILEGADLFCIKQGKAPQFGICVSTEGYKPGQQVAAAVLASALSNHSSFVGVFKVDEGWWYICVRNDIILSDGDMLFLKEEDARNQFLSMLAVPDWGVKIAPPEWTIEETEYPDLGALLQRGIKSKLQKINALRGTKLIVIIAISAVIGLWLLYSIIDNIFLAPPKPRIAPVTAPKTIRPIEKPPEVKPWEVLHNSTAIMQQCYMKINDLMTIRPPGWELGDLTCSNTSASTVWTRTVGRINWVNKALDNSGLRISGRSVSNDGNNVTATIGFEGINKVSSPPSMSTADLINTLNDLFQSIGHKISLAEESYKSPENNTYRSVKFKFSSYNNPLVWNDLLTKFSGLNITMIKYNRRNETWDYEGAIYAL